MIIEKELIEEAKEKLGDQNAFLMSELLELEDFDEKNLKACCPYHGEKTASFIYNRKNGYHFKCFGCGKSVDIIDAQMGKGMTFLDSCKWLFDKAEIKYQFGEQNVQTRAKYKYPPAESHENDKTKMYEYLASRGISKATCDYLDIRADKKGNIAFHSYDENDVLTVVNYRVPYKARNGDFKCWFAADENDLDERGKAKPYGTADILFNMNRVNPGKPLVITEGQIDCASVIEAGYTNVVSVLKGSQGMGWIEACFDWLEQFDEIIIASDNDKAGLKMRDEVINRLGTWRCKYVDIPTELEFKSTGKNVPVKDLNEVLQSQGAKCLLELINDAKDTPIKSVARLSEIKELNPNDMNGFEVGIKDLDIELMKFFTGGVTLITGAPSAGKTTFLNQIVLMAMDQGFGTFLFSRELINGMSKGWFNQVAAGRRNMRPIKLKNGNNFYVVNDDAKANIQKYYDDKFFIYKDEEENDEEALFSSMEECARKMGLKLFVVDNLMTVQLSSDTTDSNKAQTDFMNRLIKFSMKYDVKVVCIAHPRKLQNGAEIGLFDVAGTSNLVNLALRTIGLKRVSEENKEDPRHKYYGFDVVISIIKDRIFGSTKNIPVHYDKISRRFFSDYDEFDKVYKWDDNVYLDKLTYPIKEREQFPDK